MVPASPTVRVVSLQTTMNAVPLFLQHNLSAQPWNVATAISVAGLGRDCTALQCFLSNTSSSHHSWCGQIPVIYMNIIYIYSRRCPWKGDNNDYVNEQRKLPLAQIFIVGFSYLCLSPAFDEHQSSVLLLPVSGTAKVPEVDFHENHHNHHRHHQIHHYRIVLVALDSQSKYKQRASKMLIVMASL